VTAERAQVFTLEGVLAALVVLAGLVFALQAVVLTPGASEATAPADGAHLDSVLAEATADGSLRRAVLHWDAGTGAFHDVGSGSDVSYYATRFDSGVFDTEFKRHLNAAFGPGVAVNVVVHYETNASGRKTQRLLYNGPPGDGAVRGATTLALYDGDPLYDAPDPQSTTVSETPDFYASDVTGVSNDLYNVLEVEVVVWQT
jgi:hypothetical protein